MFWADTTITVTASDRCDGLILRRVSPPDRAAPLPSRSQRDVRRRHSTPPCAPTPGAPKPAPPHPVGAPTNHACSQNAWLQQGTDSKRTPSRSHRRLNPSSPHRDNAPASHNAPPRSRRARSRRGQAEPPPARPRQQHNQHELLRSGPTRAHRRPLRFARGFARDSPMRHVVLHVQPRCANSAARGPPRLRKTAHRGARRHGMARRKTGASPPAAASAAPTAYAASARSQPRGREAFPSVRPQRGLPVHNHECAPSNRALKRAGRRRACRHHANPPPAQAAQTGCEPPTKAGERGCSATESNSPFAHRKGQTSTSRVGLGS